MPPGAPSGTAQAPTMPTPKSSFFPALPLLLSFLLLLAKTFRGELVLQDPNDEPAGGAHPCVNSRTDNKTPARAYVQSPTL